MALASFGVCSGDSSHQPLDLRALHFSSLVKVVLHLHAGPKLGAGAKGLRQPAGHVSRNTCRLCDHAGQRDPINAQLHRGLGHSDFTQIFPKDFPGVRGIVHPCHMRLNGSRGNLQAQHPFLRTQTTLASLL